MDNSQTKSTNDSLQSSSIESSSALKILIVDDSENDRVSYARYLKSDSERSYRIIEAETVEDGLELWRSQQPDVVLLDMHLPDGSGLEFLEAVNIIDRVGDRIPVIILTGQGNEKMAVNAMKLGASDYLVKGDVTAKLLTTSIRQVMRATALGQQLQRSQQQQILIAEIALRMREFLNLEDISNAIVKEVRQFFSADRAVIYQFNSDMSGTVVAEDIVSPWQPCLNEQVEDTCFPENFHGKSCESKVCVVNDIYTANLRDCHLQMLERFQVRANLVVPILLSNAEQLTSWGLLIIHQCSAPRIWLESDVQLLQQLAVQFAISIKQSELYQNLESLNSSLEEKVQERTQEIQLQAQMLEQIHDAVISTTLDGTILTWNIGSERLYEYKSNEAIGQNISMLYLNEDLPLLKSSVLIPLLEKGTHEVELRIQTKSGNIIYVNLRLSLVRDEMGNPIRVIGCSNDISDRKVAVEALRASEAKSRVIIETALAESEGKFRRLVEGGNDLIWSTDKNGAFTYLSPQFQTLFGLEVDEWIGKIFTDLVHPDDLDGLIRAFLQSIHSQQKARNIEFRHLHQNGDYIWVSINTTPIINSEGIVIGGQGILADISDRKQAEAELQSLSNRLELALRSAAIGYWEWDIPNNIAFWDDRMYEIYGVSKETTSQINYEVWSSVIHPDDRAASEITTQQIASGQVEDYDTEFRVVHPDGSIHFIQAYGTLKRDANSKPLSIIGINFDISDRKQGEVLQRRQALQKQLLLLITQAIRQPLDFNGILNAAVNQMREICNLDRVAIYRFQPDWSGEFIVESVADGWVKLVGDDVHKVWEDSYLQETQGGRFRNRDNMVVPDIYQADLQPCHIDLLEQFQARAYAIAPMLVGGTLWGLLAMYKNDQPYPWQSWEVELLEQIAVQVAIAIQQSNLYEQIQAELSIRKQTEIQLLKVNDELLRATKLKDEFLANMSHELRTPLNSILGLSEALQEQVLGALNEKQLNTIAIVESSGEHLLSLINDILDLSKISSGKMELDIASVSVKSLCNSSLVFIKQQAFKKRLKIHSDIPENINKIDIDERRIKQVLINLLTNSVKFTPNGGNINLLVTFGSGNTWQGEATIPQRIRDMNSPMIVFQVVDTGIGIASNDLQRLFQPFIQVDSALNRQYEGTGLGLALVKQIVELHGGQVMAESEIGNGSCFTVALPYDLSHSAVSKSDPIATPSLPLAVNPESAIAPLILLAEDNEANIQTFTSYLTAINYRIIVANNGEEAVAMAKANSPDIILMDIQMPTMDGLEATRQIRLDPNLINIPIIALTALAMEGDRERCIEAGANDYLSKPIKLKELNTTIQRILTDK